jgi:hypothetical protein
MKNIHRHKYKDNKICETRTLTFDPYSYSEIDLVIGLIQDNLTSDLLKQKKLMYKGDANKYYGHCYHSSQALYYLMDCDTLIPMSGEDYRGEKHWWLQDGQKIYDCTANQYLDKGKLPPYDIGKKSKWYGWKQRPQQISLDLMVRVLGHNNVQDSTL